MRLSWIAILLIGCGRDRAQVPEPRAVVFDARLDPKVAALEQSRREIEAKIAQAEKDPQDATMLALLREKLRQLDEELRRAKDGPPPEPKSDVVTYWDDGGVR